MIPRAYEPRFLGYWVRSKQFVDLVDSSTYGVRMPRASWDFVGNVKSPLPSREEQCTISDFLNRKTAAIDTFIQKREQLITLLGESRAALTYHAVTKGLVPGVPMRDSGIPWIGEIPAHWRLTAIKRLAKPGYKTFTDGDWIEAPYITDSGVRLIQTGNVGIGEYKEQGFRFVSEETFRTLRCTEVFTGDILICRLDGPVGRACIVPDLGGRMITSVDNSILKTATEHDPRYIVFTLNLPERLSWLAALSQVGGGHRLRVARSALGDLHLPTPPSEEQRQIADHLDAKLSKLRLVESQMQVQLERLREYRQALITAAVTGQLDIGESSP